MIIDSEVFIETIDSFLSELGTASLIDSKKVRDQLLDLRLMCIVKVPDTIESIEPLGEVV